MAVVGWILLGIVLLLLFLLLTILFLPICYRVIVKMDQNGLSVKAKGTWFFYLIRVFFDYPEPKKPIIKIAWFTLSKKKEKAKKPKDKKADTSNNSKDTLNQAQEITNASEEDKSSSDKDDVLAEISGASSEHTASEKTSSIDDASVNSPEESITEESTTEESSSEENLSEVTSSTEVREDSKETDKSVEDQPKQESETDSNDNDKKKKPFKETVQKLLDDIKYYKELWEDGNTKPFVKDALSRVLHILKNLMPRKIKGYVLFGAASPDVTGYVFGAYSVCRTLYPKRFFLTLEPDFEQKVLEGDLIIKGYFCVFTLLFDALRILFDKRLKVLRKKLDARKNPDQTEQENTEENSKRKRRSKSRAKQKVKGKGKPKPKTGNNNE